MLRNERIVIHHTKISSLRKLSITLSHINIDNITHHDFTRLYVLTKKFRFPFFTRKMFATIHSANIS